MSVWTTILIQIRMFLRKLLTPVARSFKLAYSFAKGKKDLYGMRAVIQRPWESAVGPAKVKSRRPTTSWRRSCILIRTPAHQPRRGSPKSMSTPSHTKGLPGAI